MTQANAETTTPAPAMNGALYLPKPRRKPLRINRQRRKRMEEIVDGLLLLLDEIDGDPDLELGDNEDACKVEDYQPSPMASDPESGDYEPELGWTATINQDGRHWKGEPHDTGRAWSLGMRYVRDGEESYGGREPSLGSLENTNQAGWGWSGASDRESDGDEGDYSEGAVYLPYLRCLRVRTIRQALVYVGEVLNGGRVRVLGRRA